MCRLFALSGGRTPLRATFWLLEAPDALVQQSRRNPDGRPKSDVIRLTKAARERFDRQLAENLDDVFKAILEVGTKDKDTAALSLLVNRAVPIRRGATVTFTARTLTTPQDCAAAFGDLLTAIGKGELTPDESNQIGASISRVPDQAAPAISARIFV